MRKKAYAFFPVLIFFFYIPSLFASTHDWGTTGVADTTTVDGIIQLTNNSFDNTLGDWSSFIVDPWSKDGKWIVYRDSSGIGGNIYNMKAASGVSYCLTENFLSASETVDNPSYGNDNKIYFEKNGSSGYEIWRMNSDGTAKINLTAVHGGIDERYVKVSPDAQWVAFFRANGLWVAKTDGTAAQNVSGSMLVNSPQHSWSSDSQWLVYQGVDGANKWIYKVGRDGTGLQSLTKPPVNMWAQQTHLWPVWSPDGEKIAFIWSVWDGAIVRYNLRTIANDGLSIHADLDSAISSSTDWISIKGPLSWSPDSRWLAYAKGGFSDKASIFITNVETPGPNAQLTTDYTDRRPIWSPAGDRILFADAGLG